MNEHFVVVRMYRQLLGDCFLIIAGSGEERGYILVDCGILKGTEKGPQRMKAIVADIFKLSGGKLDLVVVTHEHWDHISGFEQARKQFEQNAIDELWMAWTEDPADTQGRELHAKFESTQLKLQRLAAAVGKGSPGLFGFSGLSPAARPDGKRISDEIYDRLRQWAGTVRYLSPGAIQDAPGGLRAYVLGPPRNEKLLYKALPSSGDAQETYIGLAPDDGQKAEREEVKNQSPFPKRLRWRSYWDLKERSSNARAVTKDEVAAEKWLRERYFGQSSKGETSEAYRQIDDGYEMELNRLALRMDNKTNNSSLVIAFELPDQSTMIFAADAQVGNWLSWPKVEFKEKNGDHERTTGGNDLLARSRLYKVGHHGSHNATLKKDGLEKMVRPDLTALISTDEKLAREQGKKGWLMPNPRVSVALKEHTKGRTLRGDVPLSTTLQDIDEPERSAFEKRVREGENGLFVDLLVSGDWPSSLKRNAGAQGSAREAPGNS